MRLPALPFLSRPSSRPEPGDLRRELGDVVRAGLCQLPEDVQAVVILADMQGCSHAEIARRCKLPLAQVRSHLGTGRAQLRDYLLSHQAGLPEEYRFRPPLDAA